MHIIPIIQIVIAVILVTLILLQERSAGMSGLFGGGEGGVYQTRRGLERIVFYGTIVLSIAFAVLAVLQLFLAK